MTKPTAERMTPGSMTNEEVWTIVCAAAGKQAGIDTAQARTILEASGLCADRHSASSQPPTSSSVKFHGTGAPRTSGRSSTCARKPTTMTKPAYRRTPEQIAAEQKEQAAALKAAKAAPATPTATAIVPAKPASTAVAVPDSRTPMQAYLDEVAPASMVGRLIKFSKDGTFCTADDTEPVSDDADFIALCDETLVGWIKFGEDGRLRSWACSTTASSCRRAARSVITTRVSGRQVSPGSRQIRGCTR